jgi:hypothetical protein
MSVITHLAAMNAAHWSFIGMGSLLEAVIMWAWRVATGAGNG